MNDEVQSRPQESSVAFAREGATVEVRLSGPWTISSGIPSSSRIREALSAHEDCTRIRILADGVAQWDSALLVFLERLRKFSRERHVQMDFQGLPEGAERLLTLASRPLQEERGARGEEKSFLSRIGREALKWYHAAGEIIEFIGRATLALGNFFRGRAQMRRSDLLGIIQECGVNALPIVSLISILVGLIFAFVGAVQLRMFGAQIFVADLVALAMAREMAAMMTGIIMAGRTGAAFAAQLGTMQVNEEIDAFRTFGISPMEFLVLPRMLALMLMMPFLYLYSLFLGILGGAIVGTWMLDLPWVQYSHQTQMAITLTDFFIGLVKSAIFGVLVAVSGCLRGMQCGRSASAVGMATTSAVVTGIVWIIVADSIVTVITSMLGI